MAAPKLTDIMDGLEARLKTIQGLRTAAFHAAQINPPEAVIGVPPVPNYHATFARGKFQIEPTILILTSAAYDRAGQRALADYANPTGALSINAAIEGDRTLAGVVDDCIVVDFRPLGHEEVGLIGYYGGIFTLRVIATGV